MNRTAMIVGATGQDGAWLAQHLLGLGYRVIGTSRDAGTARLGGLDALGIAPRVTLASMNPIDFRSVVQTLAQHQPDEVYNLSGQSSVGLSFEQPVETLDSIGVGTINLLEAIRFLARPVRLYNAASSECFGEVSSAGADESHPFRPRSPYAVAKATSYWLVANYREAYGLFACSGILFNHESPLRPTRFVTRKIIQSACRIAAGSGERLRLGNLAIRRDWGWAPEYVVAMHAMLQREQAEDYVIATGRDASLQEFVTEAFARLGLDWQRHVDSDASLLRPTDLMRSVGNAAKAERGLGWKAATDWRGVVARLVEHEQAATRP